MLLLWSDLFSEERAKQVFVALLYETILLQRYNMDEFLWVLSEFQVAFLGSAS